MFYFKTRDAARAYATKTGKTFVDRGADADKRWAVQVISAEVIADRFQ